MYCPNCGNSQSDSTKFCTDCGHNLQQQSSTQAKSVGYDERTHYQDYGRPEKRNFWNYGVFPVVSFVLSLLAAAMFIFLGIGGRFEMGIGPLPLLMMPVIIIFSAISSMVYIYYIYLNFDDMRKLQTMSHERPYPEPMEPVIPLIAMFVFAPISFYFKYDQLHKHLKEQHGQMDNLSPSPMTLVAIFIGFFVIPFLSVPLILFSNMILGGFALVIIAYLGLGLYALNLEKSWQESLNRHIDHHNAQKM